MNLDHSAMRDRIILCRFAKNLFFAIVVCLLGYAEIFFILGGFNR